MCKKEKERVVVAAYFSRAITLKTAVEAHPADREVVLMAKSLNEYIQFGGVCGCAEACGSCRV